MGPINSVKKNEEEHRFMASAIYTMIDNRKK